MLSWFHFSWVTHCHYCQLVLCYLESLSCIWKHKLQTEESRNSPKGGKWSRVTRKHVIFGVIFTVIVAMAIAGILVGVKFYLDSANELVTVSSQMFCLFFLFKFVSLLCFLSSAFINFVFFLSVPPTRPLSYFFHSTSLLGKSGCNFKCPLIYFHELVTRFFFSNSCELVQQKDSGEPNKLN